MENKKQLTKQAVKLALDLLIASNSQATTLEIKQHLRELNFEARQEDVHNFMEEIFAEGQGKYARQLNTDTANHYNVYTAVTDWEQSFTDVTQSQSSASTSKSTEKSFLPLSENDGSVSTKKPFEQVLAEIDQKTPMHQFAHHVRESSIVPGAKIIADYDARSGKLRTHNDVEAEMNGSKVADTTTTKRAVDPIREPVKIFYTEQMFNDWREQQGEGFDPEHWGTYQRNNSNTEIHVYDKSVTRDQARSRHASLHGIKSAEIRCSKVTNLEIKD